MSTSSAWRDEIKMVTAPQFAESVSEGDVRWEKGTYMYIYTGPSSTAVKHVHVCVYTVTSSEAQWWVNRIPG